MLYSTLSFTGLGSATSLELPESSKLPNLSVVTSRTPDMSAPFLYHNAPVLSRLATSKRVTDAFVSHLQSEEQSLNSNAK